uniref:Putative secreted protein n=1 Tax=Ixodes ricinus TaxID=34613 RepID=A0A6B0UNH4_IXORI
MGPESVALLLAALQLIGNALHLILLSTHFENEPLFLFVQELLLGLVGLQVRRQLGQLGGEFVFFSLQDVAFPSTFLRRLLQCLELLPDLLQLFLQHVLLGPRGEHAFPQVPVLPLQGLQLPV